MPEMSVGAGPDELVILLQGDSTAPILPQVPAGPDGESDSNPSKSDARNRGRVGTMENALTKHADAHEAPEQQGEAGDFQKEVAGTRDKRLCGHSPARLQRAHSPIDAKDDPRSFDEIMPNQFDSVPLGKPSPSYVENNASRF